MIFFTFNSNFLQNALVIKRFVGMNNISWMTDSLRSFYFWLFLGEKMKIIWKKIFFFYLNRLIVPFLAMFVVSIGLFENLYFFIEFDENFIQKKKKKIKNKFIFLLSFIYLWWRFQNISWEFQSQWFPYK